MTSLHIGNGNGNGIGIGIVIVIAGLAGRRLTRPALFPLPMGEG